MKKLSLLQTERHLSSMSLAAAPFFQFWAAPSLSLASLPSVVYDFFFVVGFDLSDEKNI